MEYKKFAINLALEAGNTIKQNFSVGMSREWKEDNTPLTKTDIAINALIIESIKKKLL